MKTELFSTWLSSEIAKSSIKQGVLADKLNVARQTIRNYCIGKSVCSDDRLAAICKILNIRVPELTEDRKSVIIREQEITLYPVDNLFPIPIFDSVSAGFGAYPDNYIVGYRHTEISSPLEKNNYLYINVVGNSMEPAIPNGSSILVHKQSSVDSGEIAVIIIDGDEAVVKKVIYGKDWVELISLNPDYKPRRFEKSDALRLTIVGLVTEVTVKL